MSKSQINLPKTAFSMKANLPTKEPEILKFWQNINLYDQLRKSRKGEEKFVLHDGPPYANGNIHMGTALNKILKDIIVKFHQMDGKDSVYVPGWDCHGLPIEWKIEELYKKNKKNKNEVPIVEFRKECRAFAEKWIGIHKDQFKRLGVIGDWENYYSTMSYDAEAQIVRELGKFLKEGSLYRGFKPVLWSTVEKTALADAEVEYQDHKSDTIYASFPVKSSNIEELKDSEVIIWTTTPWTIPANRALAYNENLKENGYISNSQFKVLKNKKISLKKRKISLIKEAKSYTEEVRRIVNTDYGFKKLYSEGLSISTPLNGKYQIAALNSLRYGIETYDKRYGWRGPITNIYNNKNWQSKIDNLEIDPTLNWEIAEVLEINDYETIIKIFNKDKKEKIIFDKLKWTRKKNFKELFVKGDLIFVQKNKKNNWTLKQLPLVNGSIVVMNPYNGKIKALVGGYSFVSSEFNRATQAKRQPGSAFKPLVYASALENGFLPNSIILDAPFVSEQGEGLRNWKPENYGKKFYGPSTLRKGIEKSRNLMTVRVAQSVGFEKISKISKKMGVYEEVPELLSVSLGSNETTLLKLTNAYCTFINGGKKVEPILINRIQDRRGKTIFNSDKRNCEGCKIVDIEDDPNFMPKIKDKYTQVISRETAYQITSMLEGAIQRGTGKKLKNLKVPLAGKTGTTNDNFDAWFIGSTSDLTIGVYIGYDQPKSLGKFETGAKAALPVFKKFIENAIYKEEMMNFTAPETINFFSIDYDTGKNTIFDTPKSIVEGFKEKSVEEIKSKNLSLGKKRDKFIKYTRFY